MDLLSEIAKLFTFVPGWRFLVPNTNPINAFFISLLSLSESLSSFTSAFFSAGRVLITSFNVALALEDAASVFWRFFEVCFS